MLSSDERVLLGGALVHNFIVPNFTSSTEKNDFSSQLYFTVEENLERRINKLEAG